MDDEELIDEFTRVVVAPEGARLECMLISWPHPSRPESEWVAVKTLPASATAEKIALARRRLLRRRRFFGVCARCHQRKPEGWMHDAVICQSCAERYLDVQY